MKKFGYERKNFYVVGNIFKDIKMKKRILLGMSGGIDSTVAAYILKEQGYEVVGVFMKYWVDPEMSKGIEKEDKITENKCCSIESQMAAKKTCDKLGIEFHILNMIDNFHEEVVEYFLKMHKKGLTPNPCIQCNKKIKWGDIFGKMKKFNCDFIATGHYAKIKEFEGKKYIQKGDDLKKDQSYFLSVLSHKQLEKIILPLGNFQKEEIKKMAQNFGEEEIFKKKESQGVCFYNENSYVPFLKRHSPELFEEGDFIFIDKNGDEKIVGKHKGMPYYTIGQRKGIGVGGFENPVFVIGFRREKNQVLLGEDEKLRSKKILISDLIIKNELKKILDEEKKFSDEKNIFKKFLFKIKKFFGGKKYFSAIRHLGKISEIKKIAEKEKKFLDGKTEKILEITLKKPLRAITPGQFLVIYSEDMRAIGNGMII
ncbi:tRNA 2-thiouridine(34) synthase MnmA [Candidatus Gracilibacteria bacterium]|nr:tRNA 2-thiouridine(34) synthase MnmA [Candidatus Gracilibacteria bacterium]